MSTFSKLNPSPFALRKVLSPVRSQQQVAIRWGGSHWPSKDVETFGHNMKHLLSTAGKTASMWKKIFFFVMVPGLLFSAYLAYQDYLKEIEHLKHRKQEDYIQYPYLAVRTKPFPWGDGNKSFFHNPYTNWLPGVGYEKLMSEEEDAKKH